MISKTTRIKGYAFSLNLFLLFLLFSSLGVQSQNWEVVPNLQGIDSNETHISMFFLDSNTGWIGRNDGTMLKTTDGGTTWTAVATGIRVFDIFFISETKGWAVGDLNSYYTTDGGTTWTTVQAGITAGSESLLSVFFISETKGWASGFNYIYSTVDGGLNWTRFLPTGGVFSEIYFTSETVGYFVGSINYIYKTTDGGTTWLPLDAGTPFATHNSIHFVDDNTAFVCGQDGVIKKTTDAGSTWVSVREQTSNSPDLNDIFFVDANNGWAVGNERTILHTTDGGATWTQENTLSSDRFLSYRAIAFTGPTTGFALSYSDLQTYSVALVPVINTFLPTTGTYGDTVVITGENLNGTTAVTIGGVPVETFTVDSPTQITVTVGPGLSGDISVTTFGGTNALSSFTYINQDPQIETIDDVSFCDALDVYTVPVTTSDIETSAENLILIATSSNPLLVTDVNISVSGTDAVKTLNIIPEMGAEGVVTITVTLTDEAAGISQTTFELTVGGDILNPVAVTQNISVDLDEMGNAVITAQEIDFGSNDNCSSSAGGTNPIYLSGGQTNKLWSITPGENVTTQEIAVDWSVVGFYGGAFYPSNYGGLEVNELTGTVYVAGGFGNSNFVMSTPLNGGSPMETFVGEASENATLDFEIDNTTQVVYIATFAGLYKQTIGAPSPTVMVSNTSIFSVTLDVANQVLYFLSEDGIGKINTDGTGLVANQFPVTNPGRSITMDTVNQRLFWINEDDNSIYTALTNGTETPFQFLDGSEVPADMIVLDFVSSTSELYFVFTGGDYYEPEDTVFKTIADGSPINPQIIATGNFGGVTGIAVGKNVVPRPLLTLTLDRDTFTCADLGQDVSVTLTATDNSGNESTATALVTVTDTNDYCSTLSTTQFDIDNSIMLYPNPVGNTLSIKNNSNVKINSLQVYDLHGRVVINNTISNTQDSLEINTSNLQTSVYIIKIKTATGVIVKRFVKQ